MQPISLPKNCDPSVRLAIQRLANKVFGAKSTPEFYGVGLSSLTASRLVASGADKELISITLGDGLSYDTDTHILSTSGGFADEDAQDAVGTILADSSSIDFTYTDGTPEITAVVLPGGVDHDSLLNVHQDINTDATPTFLGLVSTGTIDASAGEVLVEDNATSEPADKIDGYIGVAKIGTEARIYFAVEGLTYYIRADAAIVNPTTGNPIGLLLLFTYT
jgi:hypothetical protein